ncbi:MAG: DUF2188 domain-containing protein [Mesotoga sp.]|jgi:hypothetical protein|uniref:DUF2188 domain-containing protein n=1 Tax=Mesotoga sp. TaxID=2053577 RepID=UPI0016A1E0AA|nr:DUF2188 domain-containing protein [Mesotoga sp.]MDD3682188.1 DUF2188 domain-containing protein [Mesotoga sp.]MDD4826270.1 DUF2188 domain-containing protein [Mesotoga sp.]MDD5683749.1 DUF2188 domain-containing protein [Mesotoga sp.]NLT45173.1 DUF2188 domain-containing protein [Thermotogaceae bacterium]
MDHHEDLNKIPSISENVMEDIYHVKPHEGSWIVDHESEERIIHRFDDKVDAINAASELARNSPEGKLVIHDSEGNVDKDETIKIGKSLQERAGGARVFIPVAYHTRLSRH